MDADELHRAAIFAAPAPRKRRRADEDPRFVDSSDEDTHVPVQRTVAAVTAPAAEPAVIMVSRAPAWHSSLRKGSFVEAQWSADIAWYRAQVLQIVHGGYSNATYRVLFIDYENEEDAVPIHRIRALAPHVEEDLRLHYHPKHAGGSAGGSFADRLRARLGLPQVPPLTTAEEAMPTAAPTAEGQHRHVAAACVTADEGLHVPEPPAQVEATETAVASTFPAACTAQEQVPGGSSGTSGSAWRERVAARMAARAKTTLNSTL